MTPTTSKTHTSLFDRNTFALTSVPIVRTQPFVGVLDLSVAAVVADVFSVRVLVPRCVTLGTTLRTAPALAIAEIEGEESH